MHREIHKIERLIKKRISVKKKTLYLNYVYIKNVN